MGTQIFTPILAPGVTKESVFNLINVDTGNGDDFYVYLDTEYTIDQVIVSVASGDIGTASYQVLVEYPASAEQVALSDTGQTGTWSLNDYSTAGNPNRWVRLPAGSKILVDLRDGGSSTLVLKLSVTGR